VSNTVALPGSDIDPFTLEAITDSLIAIGDEMFAVTQRTAQSTIMYEVLDFGVALTDATGELITQGNGVTLFLGTMDRTVHTIHKEFAADDIREGDIFVTNDPYGGGGTHLSDMTVAMPIFHRGELVAFAINKGHWAEIGGRDPGSVATDTDEIYQEGLQVPCLKAFHAGKADRAVFAFIEANVRTPRMSIGDLYGQVASVRMAAQRVDDLCTRHGVDAFHAAVSRAKEHSERMVLERLGRLPAGEYHAADLIDGDDFGHPQLPIEVKLTIDGGRFVCDFTGSHPSVRWPVNCSRTGLIAACRVVFKALVGLDVRTNEGLFEPLEIICPPNTVFTAERPAPVSTYWETMGHAMDLVQHALAPALGDRAAAGHFVSTCSDLVVGDHPDTGEQFIMFEANPGGWGAGVGHDGERGLVCLSNGETYTVPVEVTEQRYGVMVDQYTFDTRNAGAGQWRGGEGIIRDYRILGEAATVTARFARHQSGPWGYAGAMDGSGNAVEIIPAGSEQPVTVAGMVSRSALRTGDVVRVRTSAGGGWGDPLRRDAAAVVDDVRNQFVTVEQAREAYGLLIDADTLVVTGRTAAREALGA
jgi:N-methylhydantoinase B